MMCADWAAATSIWVERVWSAISMFEKFRTPGFCDICIARFADWISNWSLLPALVR